MISSILGKKLRHTQQFDNAGHRHPVTILEVGPCPVVQIKTLDTDGYRAVQIGFGSKTNHTVHKPQQGHMKKARLTTMPRFLREIRTGHVDIPVGSMITAGQVLQPGDAVSVTAVSKGKGFAGVVKRHHFSGGPATHGQSDRERAPGSIGGTTTPGRVYRGKRMAGRMGGERTTMKGFNVVSVDNETHQVMITGLVPGPVRGLVMLTRLNDRVEPAPVKENKPEEPVEQQKESVE